MRLITLGAMLLSAAPALAQSKPAEQSYDVGPFTTVVNETSPDVVVHVGGARSARAEGDARTIADLVVTVEGDRLVVKTRPGARWGGGRARTVVHVTTPALNAALASGSGDVRVDRVAGAGFRGSTSGSGNLTLGELKAETASLSSSGSGNVVVAGAVGRLDAVSTGSGNVDARRLTARSASVRTTGSGNVDAFASGEAEVFATGSGNATVLGTRTCRVRATGSGGVRCG
jgi:hypothetical protein